MDTGLTGTVPTWNQNGAVVDAALIDGHKNDETEFSVVLDGRSS